MLIWTILGLNGFSASWCLFKKVYGINKKKKEKKENKKEEA